MAVEPIDFDVALSGRPRLEGDAPGPDEPEGLGPPPIEELPAPPVPGWTPQEAARVVGGGVANVTIILYAMRWKAAPAAELAPAIAGNPEVEFPLMGAGLAPVLDLVAPKGSPAAIGVSLTAGIGEVVTAIARRSDVLQQPPRKRAPGPGAPAPQGAPAPASPQAPAPAPEREGGKFRFEGKALEVLRDEPELTGVGIE